MAYTQLAEPDRIRIGLLKQQGKTLEDIGIVVGRNRSTISRELRRNNTGRQYSCERAHKLAIKRKSQAASQERMPEDVKVLVIEKTLLQWSPEQISNRLALEHDMKVSHEYIYQLIYKDKAAGGSLFLNLRWQRSKRKKRAGSKDRRGQIPNRVSIEQRPTMIDERSRLGDTEGDLVLGGQEEGKTCTLVDRKSRFTVIEYLAFKTAIETAEALEKAIARFLTMVWSITLDNGKEFSLHEKITEKTGIPIFFAHAYSSYERGTNENTNGLIRQYLPKGYDFSTITRKQLDLIEDRLNNRPRKVLGYRTPLEVHTDVEIQYFKIA